jgi:phosphoglucosamine mutase
LSSLKLLNLYLKEKAIFAQLKDFVVYPQVLKNVTFATREVLEKTAANPELKAKIAAEEKTLDGHGRILVRASGTEPLLRVMVEASTLEQCQGIVDQIIVWIGEVR